jgi:uncharacterized protein involved in outer membrane biogenesis
MVSDKLERPFAIRGDLDVDWSWTPKITINEIELGNASWGSRPEMFTLDRAEVSLRIPDLFKGHLVLPEIRVSKPHLLLEKNAEGKANWDFGLPFAKQGTVTVGFQAGDEGLIPFPSTSHKDPELSPVFFISREMPPLTRARDSIVEFAVGTF